AGGIDIRLHRDERLTDGVVRIDSENVEGEVVWAPVPDMGGTPPPLRRGRPGIGRGSDADNTVDDTGTCRWHAEILWDGRRAQVTDLGSTNGSRLNGAPVTTAVLEPDSVIEIGRTRMVFRVLAQAAELSRPDGGPPR